MSIAQITGKLVSVEEAIARLESSDENDGLDAALSSCNEALSSCSIACDSAQYTRWMLAKASALRLRFFVTDAQEDLLEAQRVLDTLVPNLERGTWAHILALVGLGKVADQMRIRMSSMDLIMRSRGYYEQAMAELEALEPPNVDLLIETRTRLGRALTNQSALDDNGEIILEALALITLAVDQMDDLNPFMPEALLCLSMAYQWRWRFSGQLLNEALIKAEETIRQAIRLGPCHRYRYAMLLILSQICLNRFSGGDSKSYLSEAIDVANEALQTGQRKGLPFFRLSRVMDSLGQAYVARLRAEGRLADAHRAVDCFRLIVVNRSEISPQHFYHLCASLCTRFEETGQLIDIDDAVNVAQEALAQSPPTHWSSVYSVANLGAAFALRFIHGREHVDYEQAKVYLNDAVSRCVQSGPKGDDVRGTCLEILGNLHLTQYRTGGNMADLDVALEYATASIACKDEKHTELPVRLSALGEYLSNRFQATARPTDLMDSILNQEAALRLSPMTSSTRHLMLWRYGQALCLRFRLHYDEEDFKKSIEALMDAVVRAQDTHSPKLSSYLSELGACFAARYQVGRRADDLTTSLSYYTKAALNAEGLIADRYWAAVKGANLAQECGKLHEATEAFSTAVSLLPRIAWLGLTARSRHNKLTSASSHIACDAAASAIMAGQTERAVELLDQGRSVLWRSILHLRTDLADLEDAAPDLATELLAIGQKLENDDTGSTGVTSQHAEERAQRRRRAAERWDALLERVRCLKGFELFLKPLPFSHLRQAAVDEPVVILNVSKYRSDAIIVTVGEAVRSVALPGLDFKTVECLAFLLLQALRVAKDEQGCRYLEQVLLLICRRLWDGGLATVASTLTQCAVPRPLTRLPRVWWIATGLLSLLPIHCAGPYLDDQKGIPDLFISSYTTTLAALLAARARRDKSRDQTMPPDMLAICQMDVPGYPTLSHAALEMEILASTPFAKRITFLTGSDASTESVTKALPNHAWVHCCCHGHWAPAHPLTSALLLKDGPLTLGRLVQMRLGNADFAFLSACHTARQTFLSPDESMHLAAGLQIAGFRGVIATTWGMADRDGPALAGHFYESLTIDGRLPDPRNAAEALHLAVGALREEDVPLYRWAPFVHYGI